MHYMYSNIEDKKEYKYEIKRTAILDWNTFAIIIFQSGFKILSYGIQDKIGVAASGIDIDSRGYNGVDLIYITKRIAKYVFGENDLYNCSFSIDDKNGEVTITAYQSFKYDDYGDNENEKVRPKLKNIEIDDFDKIIVPKQPKSKRGRPKKNITIDTDHIDDNVKYDSKPADKDPIIKFLNDEKIDAKVDTAVKTRYNIEMQYEDFAKLCGCAGYNFVNISKIKYLSSLELIPMNINNKQGYIETKLFVRNVCIKTFGDNIDDISFTIDDENRKITIMMVINPLSAL